MQMASVTGVVDNEEDGDDAVEVVGDVGGDAGETGGDAGEAGGDGDDGGDGAVVDGGDVAVAKDTRTLVLCRGDSNVGDRRSSRTLGRKEDAFFCGIRRSSNFLILFIKVYNVDIYCFKVIIY